MVNIEEHFKKCNISINIYFHRCHMSLFTILFLFLIQYLDRIFSIDCSWISHTYGFTTTTHHKNNCYKIPKLEKLPEKKTSLNIPVAKQDDEALGRLHLTQMSWQPPPLVKQQTWEQCVTATWRFLPNVFLKTHMNFALAF